MTEFDQNRDGTGTREWSEHSINIGLGCSHGCLYCYGREHALRFKRISSPSQWDEESLNEKAVRRQYGQKNGVIMTPTMHDITPYYLPHFIKAVMNMLAHNNQVLIVSKPHLECVKQMCEAFQAYKDKILFRFTIGSLNPGVCEFWEPGAPPPDERVLALKYAYSAGFQTSVSIEPMLGGVGSTVMVIDEVRLWVSETIWVGKMNFYNPSNGKPRVNLSDSETRRRTLYIETAQRDQEILRLYALCYSIPQIRWKDSIKKVLQKHAKMIDTTYI